MQSNSHVNNNIEERMIDLYILKMRFNKTWECFSLVKDLPVLSLVKDPSRPNAGRREKINLKFYFHTSLWCLKRFYEGFKGFRKTFRGTTKKCKNKNLTYFFSSSGIGMRRVNLK